MDPYSAFSGRHEPPTGWDREQQQRRIEHVRPPHTHVRNTVVSHVLHRRSRGSSGLLTEASVRRCRDWSSASSCLRKPGLGFRSGRLLRKYCSVLSSVLQGKARCAWHGDEQKWG